MLLLILLLANPVSGQISAEKRYYGSSDYYHSRSQERDEYPRQTIDYDSLRESNEYLEIERPVSYGESEYLTKITVGTEDLKIQVQRLKAVYKQIHSMDHYETRLGYIEIAQSSLKLARSELLAHNFEESSIAMQIAMACLDFAVSWTPFVGWGRDVWESVFAKDIITGEQLGSFARSLAILGVVTGGIGSKAGKIFDVLHKVIKTDKITDPLRTILYNKPLSELKETVSFFKKYKFWKGTDQEAASFINASLLGAKVKTLEKEREAIRYYDPKFGDPKSNFLTTELTSNPVEHLALRFDGNYIVEKWIIPAGTEILESKIAPNWGRKGGNIQVIIGDPSVLRKVQ